MFAGFLRVSEAVGLTRDDVILEESQIIIVIRSSKTDQVGKSERRPVRWVGRDTCVVSNLERWTARIPQSRFLFPNLSSTSKIVKEAMSTDAVWNELVRVKQVCRIERNLTPHSFRGGAATADIEKGVPTHSVRLMGRWNTTQGFAPYVQVSARTLHRADDLL